MKILTYMSERNLTLVSFRENIDLSTSAGRMLAGICPATMAEYERSIISERTKAGMRSAKAKGKQIGNPKVWFDKRKAADLRRQGWGRSHRQEAGRRSRAG